MKRPNWSMVPVAIIAFDNFESVLAHQIAIAFLDSFTTSDSFFAPFYSANNDYCPDLLYCFCPSIYFHLAFIPKSLLRKFNLVLFHFFV